MASSERPTRAGSWQSRSWIAEEQLTLGDLVDAITESAADNLEAALVIEDLVTSGRVRLTSLEGYLLTGRHGFFSCYEAFIHIADSMFSQHADFDTIFAQGNPG